MQSFKMRFKADIKRIIIEAYECVSAFYLYSNRYEIDRGKWGFMGSGVPAGHWRWFKDTPGRLRFRIA